MKKVIYICLFSFSVLINLLILYFFREKAVFSGYSFPAVAVMFLVTINGVVSFFLRHKGNFLPFGAPRGGVFLEDRGDTFGEEYKNEFYWMFLVYCMAIPFYIPCIFFASEWKHTLWTLCVLFVPQIAFIIHGISKTMRDVKEYKVLKQKQEQELKEQQRREELGFFK